MKQQIFVVMAKIIGLSCALSAFPAMAAPPPPVPIPPTLEEPIDGYDMREPYQLWRYWVESRKGPVTEALLAEPEVLEGLRHYGLLLRFEQSNDFGHGLTGEIRVYCQPTPGSLYDPLAETCLYILRRAYVPLNVANSGETNPLSKWALANFDPQGLAIHLREIGLSPNTHWWSADREAIFSAAASPLAVLTDNAVVTRLDSTECPEMEAAIKALEGKSLGGVVDFVTVGEDRPLRPPPPPHAVKTNYTIHLRGDGGGYAIQGWGGPAEQMASPILEAANTCAQARKSDN